MATIVMAGWWEALSKEHQEEYIKEHPESKYADQVREKDAARNEEPELLEDPPKKNGVYPHNTEHPNDNPLPRKESAPSSKEKEAYIAALPPKDKKFFKDGSTEAGSPMRKKAGSLITRGSKGIAKHLKHQCKEWKLCVGALKKLAKKQPLDDHDKHAIKETATDLAIVIGGTLLTGGISHGISLALGHVGSHFLQEAGLKAFVKGLIHGGVITASMSDDEALDKIIAHFGDLVDSGKISEDEWTKVAKDMVSKHTKENPKLNASVRLSLS